MIDIEKREENLKSTLEDCPKGIYSFEDTQRKLVEANWQQTFCKHGGNKTLKCYDPRLYKSVYVHSEMLERKMKESGRYVSSYNLTHRMMFIVERNGDIESMKCSCGRRYGWTPYCRQCSDYKDMSKTLSSEKLQDWRRKIGRASRLHVYAEMKKQGLQARYSVLSIAVLDRFSKDFNLDLRHAENGGEFYLKDLGYWIDGYDSVKNVVVEIDEPTHFCKDLLRDRDIRRHKEIQELLGCSFYHIYFNHRTNRVCLYNSPDNPDNWSINKGLDLNKVSHLGRNGVKIYEKYE